MKMTETQRTDSLPTASCTPFITVTGADERTEVGMLCQLDAEIGVLYSAAPEGHNRYPGKEWIRSAARQLSRVAIHICGSNARSELFAGRLADLMEHVQRIQVNGILTTPDCERVCAMYPAHTIITQHSPVNECLLAVKATNHALLMDESGGLGISPKEWRHPDTHKALGYAGGLGPDNLAAELRRIACVAQGPWWVDMEGKLRIDDWFSFELARDAVSVFHARNRCNEREAGALVQGRKCAKQNTTYDKKHRNQSPN